MAADLPARLSAAAGRRFGLTVGGAFLVLAAVAWWRHHPLTMQVLGGLGGLLAVAGLAAPSRLGPVERAWMGLAHAISKVTTPVFMAVVYFLVLTPIGLVMRGVGRQPMRHPERDGGFWSAPTSGGRSDLTHHF